MRRLTILALLGLALVAGPALAAPSLANPVTLSAPSRGLDLALRVTFPPTGKNLPVVLFSHGAAFSKDDYRPLADHWAANGFVVIQPTHLDARVLGLKPDDPRLAQVWRTRIEDLKLILDRLAEVESKTPGLAGRIDRRRIVVAGHSYGGHTAEALLGAAPTDPETGTHAGFADPRIRAGLLLAAPGAGGESLSPAWRDRRYLDVDWTAMRGPVLVVVGDRDDDRIMTVRDWGWRADAYRLSPPGAKCLWVIGGAGHYLGGIDGGLRPTLEGDGPRLERVERATLAYLKAVTAPRPGAWPQVVRTAIGRSAPPDRVECK